MTYERLLINDIMIIIKTYSSDKLLFDEKITG